MPSTHTSSAVSKTTGQKSTDNRKLKLVDTPRHIKKTTGTQIYKSWLLWRIILIVAGVILIVQSATLVLSLRERHTQEMAALTSQITTHLSQALPAPGTPLTNTTLSQALNTPPVPTIITGITAFRTVYDPVHNTTSRTQLGTATLGTATSHTLATHKQQIQLSITDINTWAGHSFTVTTSPAPIRSALLKYAAKATLRNLALAALVILVLTLSLAHWLIGPILFMRDNLREASKNPEKPKIPPSPYSTEGTIGGAIAIAQNLIKQNALNMQQTKSSAEDKIYKLAYFDPLTKLPNRVFFLQQVERAIHPSAGRPQKQFYIIAIDIDHFKDINDSMGHNVGDAILRSVGQKLKSGLPPSSIVSRTGEDEFAIMLEITPGQASSDQLINDILDLIRTEPFKIFNEDVQVRASAGMVSFPQHGDDHEKLVKYADIALNKAKEDGRNTYKAYSEDFERAIQHRFTLLRNLRDAMEHDQLVLFYQPQLDLKTGGIIGAEALIRWWKPDNSPEGGRFISPGEFIPIAENSGLIVPMGEWIMRQAAKDCQIWNERHGLDMRVAINISAAQFSHSDLTALTQDLLHDYNLTPDKIELEVTESVFMDDINQTIDTLNKLHALGVELAIDDFGTGYSSLSYLRQFPIDRLKIDQSFIRNALNNPDDASIAKTIIALGRSLNLKVIAEGVETREHENFLISEGCDEVQGFRYSKPLPNDRFIEFCKGYNGDLRSFSRI